MRSPGCNDRVQLCVSLRGQCTFVDERGRRCPATGNLEFEHVDGFALTHLHDEDRIRLMCRSHNQHAAEKTYGRAFMERARSLRASTCSGPGRGALGAATRQLELLGGGEEVTNHESEFPLVEAPRRRIEERRNGGRAVNGSESWATVSAAGGCGFLRGCGRPGRRSERAPAPRRH